MTAKRLVPKLDGTQITIAASLLVGLPLFVYILRSVDIQQVRTLLDSIHIGYIGAYLFFSVLTLVVYTDVWRMFLQCYHSHLSLSAVRLFNYRMVGFALSYVTPGPRIGGEITRGGLIEADTSMSQRDGTMAAVLEMFCIFVAGLFFDTAMVLTAVFIFPQSWLLQLSLGILVGLGFIILCGWYGLIEQNGSKKIVNWTAQLLQQPDAFQHDAEHKPKQFLQENMNTFIKGVLLCLLTKLFIALQMIVLFLGFGMPITFLQALFLTAAIDIAYSIPSYMGLGALEAGQSGIVKLIGGSVSTGVTIAFITRIRDIIFSGYGLLALSYYTSHQFKVSE